jgi:hypothetical protein
MTLQAKVQWAMNLTGLCAWKKSGRNTMSTNFLPLPSGGFIASQPKPCYTLSRLPTLINYISNLGFYQGIFAIDKISLLYNTVNTKLLAAARTVTIAAFFMPISWLYAVWPKGSSKGTRLLIIAELSGNREVRASLEDVVTVRLSLLPDYQTSRRCPMASKQNGFRPGSKPNWRKRLASITLYLEEFHSRNQQRRSK